METEEFHLHLYFSISTDLLSDLFSWLFLRLIQALVQWLALSFHSKKGPPSNLHFSISFCVETASFLRVLWLPSPVQRYADFVLGLIGDAKLTVVVKMSANCCLSLYAGTAIHCPGCPPPLAQYLLGLAPDPHTPGPSKENHYGYRMDDSNPVLISMCPYTFHYLSQICGWTASCTQPLMAQLNIFIQMEPHKSKLNFPLNWFCRVKDVLLLFQNPSPALNWRALDEWFILFWHDKLVRDKLPLPTCFLLCRRRPATVFRVRTLTHKANSACWIVWLSSVLMIHKSAAQTLHLTNCWGKKVWEMPLHTAEGW